MDGKIVYKEVQFDSHDLQKRFYITEKVTFLK